MARPGRAAVPARYSGDFVEEREPQTARFDHVAALEWRLSDDLTIHAHPMPGGQVADLVAGAIAEHEHVLLGTRGHAQIAQRRLAHEDGAALQPLEIERVLLSARLPLEVRAALQGHALSKPLHFLEIHVERLARARQLGIHA